MAKWVIQVEHGCEDVNEEDSYAFLEYVRALDNGRYALVEKIEDATTYASIDEARAYEKAHYICYYDHSWFIDEDGEVEGEGTAFAYVHYIELES